MQLFLPRAQRHAGDDGPDRIFCGASGKRLQAPGRSRLWLDPAGMGNPAEQHRSEYGGDGIQLADLQRSFRADDDAVRSEEHTSELQSRLHLVCRLLLEKKKTNNSYT